MSGAGVQTSALDPVTRYATDVVAGAVVAGRLQRLACQRHLNDLRDAAAKGLEWRPVEAQRVIDFFAKILYLPEAVDAGDEDEEAVVDTAPKPFVLTAVQQFIVGSLFGWYTARGRRRFRFSYEETGKGSGKTPKAAGIAIYRAVGDRQRNSQNFFAATKLDQARVTFRDAEKMIEASPSLRKVADVTVNNIAFPKFGSFIRAISSEKRGLDGIRVSTGVVEELHEHPTGTVVQKVRKGMKGQPNGLLLEPTNAGFDRNSICWDHHELSRQVLEGTVVNERWFAFIAQLDPCEKCLKEGKQFPSEDCRTCDDWRTEGPHWLKANPNLGVTSSWEQLREEVRIAIAVPSEQNMTKRLNFGIWTDQVTVWITTDLWKACEGPAAKLPTWERRAEVFRGRECYVGVDLSSKIDLASVQFIFPRPLERTGARPGADDITRAIDVLSFFWIPERTMLRRAKEDNVPYPTWKEAGYLFSTTGHLVDHDAIVDFIVDIVTRFGFRMRGCGVDESGATAFITRLQKHFGEQLVTEVPQGFKVLSSPSKTLEALVLSGNLAHDGNPVMTWCIGNMGKEENSWQSIRPVKLHQRKRIDGGVALIDAICTMERTAPQADSVYNERGVLSLADYL